MRVRSALAVLAATAMVAAPAANAATKKKPPAPKPKTYCNLLVDSSKGDESWNLVPVVTSPGLDVQTGDVATGGKEMVAVLRLGSTNFSPTSDHWALFGYNWVFGFDSSAGTTFEFDASTAWGGPVKGSVQVDHQSAPSTFSVDSATNSFKWVVNRKDVPSLSKPHLVFKGFRAHSEFLSGSADDAPSMPPSDTYPDRGLSCVKAN